MRSAPLFALALLLALAAPNRALADVSDALASADEQAAAGDFARAQQTLEGALHDDLTDRDLKDIYERLGVVHLYLKNEPAAVEALERLLLSDPAYEPSPGSPKALRALFARVKKSFAPVEIELAVPDEHPAGEPLELSADIRNQPRFASARLYFRRASEGTYRWTALEREDGGERHRARLSGAALETAGSLELYAELVDAQARRVAGEGSAISPRRIRLVEAVAEVPPEALEEPVARPQPDSDESWFSKPVVWGVIGVAVIAGGAVLAYYAASEEPSGSEPVRVKVVP